MIAVDETPERALARLHDLPDYGDTDFVQRVSTAEPYDWDNPVTTDNSDVRERPYRILVDDCGLKYNILRMLRARGCEVKALPARTTADDILALKPDGVVMSPGPGDPELLDYAVETARGIAGAT